MTTAHSSPTTRTATDGEVPVRRPALTRLVAVEFRKMIDTRAGRWMLAVVLATAVAALGYRLLQAGDDPVAFSRFFGTSLIGVQMLLPALGVLAMTAEWTQRTALVTFTLVPGRGRVLSAKLLAAVGLSGLVVLVVAATSALATLAGGLLTADPAAWDEVTRHLGGAVISTVCSVLMGAAFGALLQQTAAGLVLYFAAPPLWASAAPALLGEHAQWLDVFAAFGALAELDLSGVIGPTIVALGAWIVLPLTVGTVRGLRREVS